MSASSNKQCGGTNPVIALDAFARSSRILATSQLIRVPDHDSCGGAFDGDENYACGALDAEGVLLFAALSRNKSSFR